VQSSDYSFDLSKVVSLCFTFPSTVMSSRKLSSFTKPRPALILISFRSVSLTTPSAFTSPVRKVIVGDASTELDTAHMHDRVRVDRSRMFAAATEAVQSAVINGLID